jgi:methylmalonyl-CoA mutase N-terminal domain/subunit
VQRASDRGLPLETFAPRLSFFFAAHNDLFEEVAKFRAARRLWANLMRDRWNASDAACRLRFHTQTGGVTLTAQQPHNNIVRVTVQALAAVLGGTQSLHTNGYDEALALPSEESARTALRTQQILANESGVADTVDPLGGSWYVESLTDALEAEAIRYIHEIDRMGGAAGAIEYVQDQISRAAWKHQQAIESGDRVVVGVNRFTTADQGPPMEIPAFAELEAAQKRRLAEVRSGRDASAADTALRAVADAASGTANMVTPMIDAVRSGATLGEISDVLRTAWGTYRGVATARRTG